MRRAIAGLALLAAGAGSGAQARITVDDIYLECLVTEQPAAGQSAAGPVEKTWLRIADDLLATWDEAKGAWFRNACAVSPEVRLTYRRCGVTDDKIFVIVAYDRIEGGGRNSYDGETIIDRRTGHYTRTNVMKVNGKTVLSASYTGKCERSDAHRGAGEPNKF